jgi:hypothetical protein
VARTGLRLLLTFLTMAERAIVGFHRDEQDDWIAELECGHGQHLRHRPWELRPWVMTAEGRREHMGKALRCRLCDEACGPKRWSGLVLPTSQKMIGRTPRAELGESYARTRER